ncbi:HAD-like domain-containing protein [Multifurca ochricompacta]|uniref:Mitochondrial import inner membrane translocase subunit TIM50 n=1 Tax=Multifurca ochricompacta TaxID=376703 RepID=A0AAD4M6K0_9AGAM|nr:HAD-like domain-containing protein [Multifurca ochricompacta]
MYSTLLTRTARRVAVASPSSRLAYSYSFSTIPNQGSIPPKNTPHSTATTTASSPPYPGGVLRDSYSCPTDNAFTRFAPPQPGTEQERTGAKSSRDSLSSIERRRRQLGRVSFGLFAIGLLSGCVYLGREWSEDELVLRKSRGETIPDSRWGRTSNRFSSMFDYFSKPIWQELLPPMLPPPHQKPYTLLLSIDDLLVTSTWDRQHGWRTAKRPGVDYFLAYLSQFYEIVIFTTQHHYTALPVIEKLDPYNFFIMYKLFRESTRSSENGPVKDLSYLNRPLDRVIILDTHPEHVVTNPENAIILKPWKGESGDKGLIELIPFLESIGIYKPPDVRAILKAYEGKNIPLEYAKKEAENKQAFIEEWKARGGGKGISSGGFTFSSLFSGGAEKHQPPLPLTYLDAKRREAQNFYREEQKYIREHKGEFDALIEADRQAQANALSGPLWASVAATLGGGAPPPPAPGEDQKDAEMERRTERTRREAKLAYRVWGRGLSTHRGWENKI